MTTTKPIRDRIHKLQRKYIKLKTGKESLLNLINEAELSEQVYNSNAIENSTLTLKETERILLELEVARNVSLREVFEAKNLAKVNEYISNNLELISLNQETLLLLHQFLLTNISDDFAGRFRKNDEYVRVGTHIAPAPSNIETLMDELFLDYSIEQNNYFLDKIANFHLKFEAIHPFNDGNGRIGRVLINWQLNQQGLPNIIIRDKEKKAYYKSFNEFNDRQKTKSMEKLITHAVMESLHKRITYLEGKKIIKLADFAKTQIKSTATLLNAAKRQTIPAFREKGIWKIGI